MKTQFLSFVFMAAIGCLMLCGCEPEKAPQREPPEVTVSLPVQRDVVDYAEFTGRTSAQESVDIRARVKGFLESADFTDGDMVDKDQLMFVIEQRPFEASLDAAKATKQQTQAAVRLAQADVARNKPLYESRTISAAEYDTLIAKLESAIAKIKADDAAIEQAEIDLSYTKIYSPLRGLAGRKLVDPGNLVGSEGSTLLTTVVQISPMY
ncbi:MAG: efflux RND transporter periplasmic adaptor subunit, partial [Thermoguttaceae bacterium]